MNFPKEISLPKDKNFLGIVISSFSQLCAVKTEVIWINNPKLLEFKNFNNLFQIPLMNAQRLSNQELLNIHTSYLEIKEQNISVLSNIFSVNHALKNGVIYNLTFFFDTKNMILKTHILETMKGMPVLLLFVILPVCHLFIIFSIHNINKVQM